MYQLLNVQALIVNTKPQVYMRLKEDLIGFVKPVNTLALLVILTQLTATLVLMVQS